jgi:hypothetical protein
MHRDAGDATARPGGPQYSNRVVIHDSKELAGAAIAQLIKLNQSEEAIKKVIWIDPTCTHAYKGRLSKKRKRESAIFLRWEFT